MNFRGSVKSIRIHPNQQIHCAFLIISDDALVERNDDLPYRCIRRAQ